MVQLCVRKFVPLAHPKMVHILEFLQNRNLEMTVNKHDSKELAVQVMFNNKIVHTRYTPLHCVTGFLCRSYVLKLTFSDPVSSSKIDALLPPFLVPGFTTHTTWIRLCLQKQIFIGGRKV